MAARTEFPNLRQPEDPSISVWRYLDLPKFLSFLAYRSLWFTRLGVLQDSFEGAVPEDTISKHVRGWHESGVDVTSIHDAHFPSYLPRKVNYVCCWHASECESDVMWRLYGGGTRGVAIHSRYSALVSCFSDAFTSGEVKYVDYSTLSDSARTVFSPSFWKRREYSAEREIRVVTQHYQFKPDDDQSVPLGNPGTVPTLARIDDLYDQPPGIKVHVDLAMLIDEIVVNPYADDLFFDVIQQSVVAFGLRGKNVRWSSLRHSTPLERAKADGEFGRGSSGGSAESTRKVVPGIPVWTSGASKTEHPA